MQMLLLIALLSTVDVSFAEQAPPVQQEDTQDASIYYWMN